MVYVLNVDGEPLMPCKEAKARHLLEQHKAKVVRNIPFTIQLLFECDNEVQPVNLGIDSGSKHIGVSATTEMSVLYEADVELRNDIKGLLEVRRAIRSTRRLRKTRYRKARYLNRKSRFDLMPSVRQKIDTHLQVISFVYKILPVSKIIVETANFDIHKIQKPSICGSDYMYGDQYGFLNVREYVLWRDDYICQCCKGKTKDSILHVHHIETRKTGGEAPNNLITLCKTCHDRFHSGVISLPNFVKRGERFRDATFMNIMRWRLYSMLKETYGSNVVSMTFGYKTKALRLENKLPKEHYIDARCISGNPLAHPCSQIFYFKKVRRHCRHLYKDGTVSGGVRRKNQGPYELFGYHRYDLVKYCGRLCYINSLRVCGAFQIKDLLEPGWKKSITYRKLTNVQIRSGFILSCKDAVA